jgi:hypothetical protein
MNDTHRESVLLRLLEYEANKEQIKQEKQERCSHKFTIRGRVSSVTGIQSRTCELCYLKLTYPLWKWSQGH